MFSPAIIQIDLQNVSLDIQEIEFELVKELKQKYKFNVTEIVKEKILLRDAFPILKCEFEKDLITVSSAITEEIGLQDFKDILGILYNKLSFFQPTIKKFELGGVYKHTDNKKLVNFSLEDEQLTKLNISFSVVNSDNAKITVKFFHDSDKSSDLALINYESSDELHNINDLIAIIDREYGKLTETMSKYTSVQEGDLIFNKLEVSDDE